MKKILTWGLLTAAALWFGGDHILTNLVKDSTRRRHPYYHHALIPGSSHKLKRAEFEVTYKINSLGLRSPEVGTKQRPRVLLLGDSMFEGVGVEYEDSPAAVLERCLDGEVEVINAGIASYSPAIELVYLQREGMQLQPDVVVLNYDPCDLHDDSYVYPQFAHYDDKGKLSGFAEPEKPKFWFIRNFYFTNKVLSRLGLPPTYNDRPVFLWGRPAPQELGDPMYDRMWFLHDRPTRCEAIAEVWTASFDYLKRIQRIADAAGIPTYAVLQPYALHVSATAWATGRKAFGFGPGVYPMTHADCFRRFGPDAGITAVEVLPYFQKHPEPDSLFYDSDPHMTKAGYRVFGEAICDKLRQDERFTAAIARAKAHLDGGRQARYDSPLSSPPKGSKP